MPEEPLHILLTDPHLRGGGQVRYVTNLASELVRRGHRVSIGCKQDSVLVESAREAQCEAYNRFTYRGGLRPRTWFSDITAFQRYLREQQPDIIHVNGSQDHWTSALGNRMLGDKACIVRTRHNTYSVANHLPNRTLNRRWTDYQIVVCDVVRKNLARQMTFDARRMCTIHNGVDAERFQRDEEARARARVEFGYTEEHLVCGIAARLVKAKGHEFLFKAMAQIKESHPELRLLVLGQGDLEEPLKRLAADLGLADRILFAGFRDDMAFCTQAFDIGVLPSIDCDTSSFSLKEEMAMEMPIVASDYGGLKEILTDGVEGFVVPAGTVAPLAACIRRLADHPEVRQKMGKAGRRRVLREFTVEVFAEKTVAAYRRALAYHRDPVGFLR